MLILKNFLDKISPKASPPELQEAEKENRKYDTKKLDESIFGLQRASEEFAQAISQVVKDLAHERKEHRRNEKTHSRSAKT